MADDVQSGLDAVDQSQTSGGALPAGVPTKMAPSKSGLSIPGNVLLGTKQTDEILKNMQDMIDQRKASGTQDNLREAMAWLLPTVDNSQFNALSAIDKQKEQKAKEIFDMQTQMAAFKAAQAQQQNAANSLDQILGGGGPNAGGAGMPSTTTQAGNFSIVDPQVMAEVKRLRGLGRITEAEALYDSTLKKAAEVYASPEMDKKTVDVLLPDGRPDVVSPREYRMHPERYNLTPQGQAAINNAQGAPATHSGTLDAAVNGIYGQESNFGKADTSKPNYAGAVGPMQITQDTFDTMKKQGLIPPNADINDPQQNMAAGKALIASYYKKYDGDIDKTYAAYYAGPGAINADGTINRGLKDPKNPNAPSVGEYIEQAKQKAGLATAPAQVVTPPAGQTVNVPRPTLVEAKAAQEADKAAQIEAGQQSAKSSEAQRAAFEDSTRPIDIADRKTSYTRIQSLLASDPSIAGVLASKGYANAIGKFIKEGVTTPKGQISLPALEDAIFQTLPETTDQSIAKRHELASYLARMELDSAALIKGQGTISNSERQILRDTSTGISDPSENIYKRAKQLERRADLDKELSSLYGDGSKYKNFRQFERGQAFNDAVARYEKDIAAIKETDYKLDRSPKSEKVEHPEDIQKILNKYKKAQ